MTENFFGGLNAQNVVEKVTDLIRQIELELINESDLIYPFIKLRYRDYCKPGNLRTY